MRDFQDISEVQTFTPTEINPVPKTLPESSNRGKNRFKKTTSVVSRILLAASLLTTSAGSIEVLTKGGVSKAFTDFTDRFSPRPEKPVFPYDRIAGVRESRDATYFNLLQQSIDNYQSWQSFNEANMKTLLNKRQPKEVWEILQQQDMSSLQQATSILQSAYLMGLNSDKIQISKDQKNLWINDDKFDLQDRFDMQLANTILQTKIQSIRNDGQSAPESVMVSTEPSTLSNEYKEDETMLKWLKKHPANLTIDKEGMAFFNKDEMVKIARFFYAMDKVGIEQKGQITWCNSYNCLFFADMGGEADFIFKNKESIKPDSGADVVVHEFAHQETSPLSKINFYQIGRGVEVLPTDARSLTFVSNYAMTNGEEDLAETFEHYVMNGDAFRSKLKDLKVKKSAAYPILQKKYDFMKNEIFKGMEFSKDAIIKQSDKPISIGQQRVVLNEIKDSLWYPEKPEVCITGVSIVSGPYTQNISGQTQNVWEVEVSGGIGFGTEPTKYSAFVSEEFLGEELKNHKA